MPFGRRTHAAATDTALYVGTSDRYEIRVYGPDGSLRKIIRRRWQAPVLTPEEVDRYWEPELARADRPERLRALQDIKARVPASETAPAFDAFLVDDVGCL